MSITPAYAAIAGLVFVVLAGRTIVLRRRFGVALGDGDRDLLRRAARAHANFSEYVPLALLLVWFLESETGSALAVHALCISLLVARVAHAFGVSRSPENYRFRVFGMVLTFGVIVVTSVRLLAAAVF